MNSHGKGDTPRPFSVDQETFESNWERTFKKELDRELSLPEKHRFYAEYVQLLQSGRFQELHPELTGTWDLDKDSWYTIVAGS